MSNISPFNGSQISSVFGKQQSQNDLASGIASSFGIVGYRGKVWRIKYRGEEKPLLREDKSPVHSIECVVVGASKNISKIYYAAGYTEGSSSAPDCFSNDGIVPDASASNKQSPTCATCKRNVWGAVISPVTGKPKKECADNKRLAIVPLDDIANEVYGGPMLLRVPAASLQDLAHFGNKMSRLSYDYYTFGTKISFYTEQSYPKFQFDAIRPLTDDEAKQVLALRDSPLIARILSENIEFAAEPQDNPANVFQEKGPWIAPTPTQKTSSSGQGSPVKSLPAQPVEPNTAAETTTPAPFMETPRSTATATPSDGIAATASMEPTPATGLTGSPSPTKFEKELDDMMAKLLPD